ncbi:MAG: DNA-protecting protein DprA [Leadbetterella sp.]|nr:DNA-protecting protein DprA [Leadbetterella sp.]
MFAVPGDLGRKQSEGTHDLIFNHKAHIFTDTATLVDWMQWSSEETNAKKEWDLSPFSEEEKSSAHPAPGTRRNADR